LPSWGEQIDHVGKGRLIAVMPVSALGLICVEVALVALRIGGLVLKPLPYAVQALLQKRDVALLLHALPERFSSPWFLPLEDRFYRMRVGLAPIDGRLFV
jgi:hypothetical protein